MDDMMAAKRTADSHASLKALDAIAASQAEQERAAKIAAQDTINTNARLLQDKLNEKEEAAQERMAKESVFYVSQILDLVSRTKTPIVQFHILHADDNFQQLNQMISNAMTKLSAIADKREADAVRKRLSEIGSRLKSLQGEYTASVIRRAGELEDALSNASEGKKEIGQVSKSLLKIFEHSDPIAQGIISFHTNTQEFSLKPKKAEIKSWMIPGLKFMAKNLMPQEVEDLKRLSKRLAGTQTIGTLVLISLGVSAVSTVILIIAATNAAHQLVNFLGGVVGLGVLATIVLYFVRVMAKSTDGDEERRFKARLRERHASLVKEQEKSCAADFARVEADLKNAIAAVEAAIPEFSDVQAERMALSKGFQQAIQRAQDSFHKTAKAFRS